MKSHRKILFAIVALFALRCFSSAQDTTKAIYWYTFDIENRNPIAATSPLTPEQLAKALAGTELIRLDSLRELYGKRWEIWGTTAPWTGILFVRAATVRSFQPLTGPPEVLTGPPEDIEPKDTK